MVINDMESIARFEDAILATMGLRRKKIFERVRVVYGGKYTILLDKCTGRRICKVTREKGVKNNLKKAVLYLVARYRNVYGSEIQRYFDEGCTSYVGMLEYLLQYGTCPNYSKGMLDIFNNTMDSEKDPEIGFLYILLYDRFGYNKEELDILVQEAVCSETIKTKVRRAKQNYRKKMEANKSKLIKSRKEYMSRKDLEKL